MATAGPTYATILPDDSTMSGHRVPFARPAPSGPMLSPSPKPDKPPVAMDHKPLIIGLLVIVLILTIVIVWQIHTARTAERSVAPPGPPPPNQSGGGAPTGTRESMVSVREGVVGERVSSNLSARTRTASRVAGNVVRQAPGVTRADGRHMASIAEAAEESAEDAEARTETRHAIAAALARSDEDDRLTSGSELVVGADVAARAELAEEAAPLPVRNDALMEHAAPEPEPEEEDLVACGIILASGRRSGQVCGRRCAPGQATCAAHAKSAKK